mgnify:FL=1
MPEISRKKIEKIIKETKFSNGRNLIDEGLIEDIICKDGHVQISIFANQENFKIIDPLRKQIENALIKDEGILSATCVLTNMSKDNKVEEKSVKTKKESKVEGVKKIIAVASGKGGVGKSTLAVNLASALKDMGRKVGLLDADIYGPSIPHMLNLKGKPDVTEDKKIIPFDFNGIKVMSIGFLIDEDQPVIWRGPMVHSAIKQMATDTFWGELDILIVDMPPGTGDAQITVSQNLPLDGAIIISTPQPVALNDAKKAIGMFNKVNIRILGIVENMSYFLLPDGQREDIFGKDGAKNLAANININFLGSIPLDKEIRINSDQGDPTKLKKDYFNKIANKLIGLVEFS